MGLEVLIGIARFWHQRATFSTDKNKYVILGVTGPNEYENNVNNNWYTNYIAQWCIKYASECIDKVEAEYSTDYTQPRASRHTGSLTRSQFIYIFRAADSDDKSNLLPTTPPRGDVKVADRLAAHASGSSRLAHRRPSCQKGYALACSHLPILRSCCALTCSRTPALRR